MGDRLNADLHTSAKTGTVAALHLALKARVAAIVAPFDGLSTKNGSTSAPAVLDAWLPPKPGADAQVFPFVLVRPMSGSDTEESAEVHGEAKVKLLIGTYSDTDNGWLDLIILIDALRFDFGAQPHLTNTSYEQAGPLTWELPEEQARPEWLAYVTTNWILPRPSRVDSRDPGEEFSDGPRR